MQSLYVLTGKTRTAPALGRCKNAALAPSRPRNARRATITNCVSAEEAPSSAEPTEAPPSTPKSWLDAHPAAARKILSTKDADSAAELMVNEEGDSLAGPVMMEEDCLMIMNAALDKGNMSLALSIHDAMRRAGRYRGGSARNSLDAASRAWPPASMRMTSGLVLGLCRQLAIDEAVSVVEEVKIQGLPTNQEIDFGQVVSSPLAAGRTLAVVQPREGQKLVCDAFSKYEYELFSGRITSCSSEATAPSSSMLFAAAQKVGLQWAVGGAPVGAIHKLTLQAPDGLSRTFRVATSDGSVPGQKGDRLTMVSSPFKNSAKGQLGLLSASPPDTKPGQAMSSTNHTTGAVLILLPPPVAGTNPGIPSWVLPAAVLLAGGDAASSLLDPSLPFIIGGSLVFSVGSAVTGARVILPKMKQLSDKAVSLDYVRQKLLGEYSTLESRIVNVVEESEDDIRVLARLWQLQTKMESVSGVQTAGSYGARIQRVAAARANIENRLEKRLELLDGYCRVMKMIEIEVEMDIAVPEAEIQGIEQQLNRLQELEALQDDWKIQAWAKDEVERLLRD